MTTLNLPRELLRSTPFLITPPRQLPEHAGRSQQYSTEQVAAVLERHETLLREVHHRIGNSLQIIASILMLDARKVQSDEARLHLEDAVRRILAVAAVQQQLQTSHEGGEFELAAYLRQLCKNLATSVVADSKRIEIELQADPGTVSSSVAMNIGLIVTELVINALKHAFPAETNTGRIVVTYRVQGKVWQVAVSDNGVGTPDRDHSTVGTGLGTSIVAALVRRLDAHIENSTGPDGCGTSISITSNVAYFTR